MKIIKIAGGPLPTNCYLLTDETTGASAVVDPGFESGELSEAVRKTGNVQAILLTHGHFDHISGVRKLRELTGAKVCLYSDEIPFVRNGTLNLSAALFGSEVPPFPVDVPVHDDDTIRLGGLKIRVLHTPGHTAGGCCFVVEDAIFSGDTLMKLSYGRTDFPTGSDSQMLGSLRRLSELKGDFRVYPGHGSETTLDYEKRNNPYMGIH
ncbi:MAG: MBL fold metallo-hydrolase [Oscillospiraceae bacterium]|nr:MBL fold metallo-hydrolase [Oscillospiraceae bacterium]MCI2036243.1 MBL fold metallo-hydrolase [Oscillospiraceae bacterium]